jgi:putative transposase
MGALTIDLCLSVFPWAKFRANKGAVMFHALLDHEGIVPAFIDITGDKNTKSMWVKTFDYPKAAF